VIVVVDRPRGQETTSVPALVRRTRRPGLGEDQPVGHLLGHHLWDVGDLHPEERPPGSLDRPHVRRRDHAGVGHDRDIGELGAAMNALIVGSIVVVSAALPSNASTISGNPEALGAAHS
jgi:hypothetical protein